MSQFCSEDVKKLNQRLAAIELDVSNIKTAFLKNDLGTPDYDGHRVKHKKDDQDDNTLKQYKHKFTEKLLMAVASVTGLALFTGTMSLLATKLGIGQ